MYSDKQFVEELKKATQERDVEALFNNQIVFYFEDAEMSHPFSCDGFMSATKHHHKKLFSVIMEYKYDEDFSRALIQAKVIIQVLFYLKMFENNGKQLPSVVLIADKNEAFLFHVNNIADYLDEDVDWSVAPSNAAAKYPELVAKIASDKNINPYVYSIDEHFEFSSLAEQIHALVDKTTRLVRVTEHNVSLVFDEFEKRILPAKCSLTANERVATFIGCIADKSHHFLNPENDNILMAHGKEIYVNGREFKAFFSHFDRVYTPEQIDKINAASDRLIEDSTRRRQGAFFTPTAFVDYAHRMLEERLGDDWKEKYVVWDPCWGTGNLTRDYKFNELYCSTLEESELRLGAQYNPEAIKFQYDFLNDDLVKQDDSSDVVVEEYKKLRNGVFSAIKNNKPLVIFMNPPYGTACEMGTNSNAKAGVAATLMNAVMCQDDIGASAQNLYAQFLYRIVMLKKRFNLTNIKIALFSPALFLTGPAWKKFRSVFLKELSYINGVQFQASHFADVANNWGIGFTLWESNPTGDIQKDFKVELIDHTDEIISFGEKTLYNTDMVTDASTWAKLPAKKLKTDKNCLCLSSGVTVAKTKNTLGSIVPNALGYFYNNSNNIDKNAQSVGLFTAAFSGGHGHSILPSNFLCCTSLFAARRLISCDWTNWADEYLAPNVQHTKWSEFEKDSVIYSLFNPKSNQSSLRKVDYHGRQWDVRNEFFWVSKSEMEQLANENNNHECYRDVHTDSDRYVYDILQSMELSDEAQAVLDKASELVRKSFRYRSLWNNDHPEYQVNNWDCGYYQLKNLWKEFLPAEWKEFQDAYKALADKMRPVVYEVGFLK